MFPRGHAGRLTGGTPADNVQNARRGGATVLVVDDEESLRSLMADALSDEGATVLQAVDGEDGIEQFNVTARTSTPSCSI